MTLLDRFKVQPKWKHADRAVRVEAVLQLPEDDREVLAEIAREDPDPRVRRAAVSRLWTPDALRAVLAREQDAAVCQEARRQLIALATTGEGAEATAALAALTEERDLAIVAKSASAEPVSVAAVDRLTAPRLLAAVARVAGHAAARSGALARVADGDDLVEVATRSEHRDVAIPALDRLLQQPDALRQVADRARLKPVQRRARAALRALETTESLGSEAEITSHREDVCELVDGVVALTERLAARRQLADARTAWNALDPSAADEAVSRRFNDAIDRAEAHLGSLESAEADRVAAARTRAEAVIARIRICERVEALDGLEIETGLADARREWATAPNLDDAEAAAAQVRFDREAAAAGARLEAWQAAADKRRQLAELAEAAATAAGQPDLAEARARLAEIGRAWKRLLQEVTPDDAAVRRFQEAHDAIGRRRREVREADQQAAVANLARRQHDCERFESLAQTEGLTLKSADRALREIKAALQDPGQLPTREDRDAIDRRLRAAQAALYPRAQELRDTEGWRQWANAGVQEELCQRVEALANVDDLAEVARHLREARREWRNVATAPRSLAQGLWRRFKTACDAAQARCEQHVVAEQQVREESLARKRELCERAAALEQSTDWLRTADEFKRLQQEWQRLVPVPGDEAKTLAQHFHESCDRFFSRRKEDLDRLKSAWAENLARKQDLCARAEALAESSDWQATADAFKALQAEWKTIGPVRRQKSEAIWNRFRAACDRFFTRYKERHHAERASRTGEREALVVHLESLAAEVSSAARTEVPDEGAEERPAAHQPADLRDRVLGAWTRWRHARALPPALIEPLQQRFHAALLVLLEERPDVFAGTPLDPEENRRRMEEICQRLEGYASGRGVPDALGATPTHALAALLREALAANTIGGRVDEGTRREAMGAAVKAAQSEWRKLGPVPGEAARQLRSRFYRACQRLGDTPGHQGPGGREPRRPRAPRPASSREAAESKP